MAPKKCSPAGIAAKAAGRKPKLSVAKAVPKPAAVKAKAKTKAKAKAFAPAPPPQDERLEANVKRQKTSHDGNDSAALPNDRKGSGGPLISDFMIMIPKQEPQEDSFAGDVICKEEGPPSPVGTVTLDSFVNGFQSEGDWKTKLQESWKSLDDGDLASLMQQAVECPMLKEYKILQDTKPNNPVDDFKLFVHWLVQKKVSSRITASAAASMSDKPVSPEHRGGLPDDTAEQQAPTAAATTQELRNTSSTALEEAAETAAAPMADQRVSGSPDDPAKQQAPTEAAETQEGLRSTFSTVLQETEETAAATTAATAFMSDQPVSPEHRGGLPDDTAKQQAPTAADATQEELHSASSTALQETAETAAAPMAHQPVSASPKHGYTSPDDPAKQQAATHPAATLDKMGNTRSTAPLETANKHKATSISAASARTDVEFVEVFLEDEAKCVAAVKQHHLFPAYLKFCQKHKPFIHFDWTHPGDGKQVDTVRNIRHFNSYLKNAEAPLLDISKLLRQYEAAMFDYDSTDDYVFPDLLLRVRSHPMFNEFIEDVYTNIEEPRYIQSGWTFGSWPHNDFKKFNTFLIQKGQPPIDLAEAWPAILAGWHYGLSTAELDLLSEEDFISALSAAQGHPLFREFWSSQLLEKPHQPRFASSSAHQVSNLESFVIYLRDTVKAYMKAGVAGEEHFNKYFGKMAPEETAGEGKQEQVEVEESKQAAMEWWSNCDPEFIANSLMNDENCPYCLEDEISRVKKFEHFAEYFHFLKKEEFVDDDYSYGDPEGDPVEDLVHFLRWFQKSPHSKINTETVTKRLDQKEAACASSLACNMMLFQTH